MTGDAADLVTIADGGLTALGLSAFTLRTGSNDDHVTVQSDRLAPWADTKYEADLNDRVGDQIVGAFTIDGGSGNNTFTATADTNWLLKADETKTSLFSRFSSLSMESGSFQEISLEGGPGVNRLEVQNTGGAKVNLDGLSGEDFYVVHLAAIGQTSVIDTGTRQSSDRLTVVGTSLADAFILDTERVIFNTLESTVRNIEYADVDAGDGEDLITIAGDLARQVTVDGGDGGDGVTIAPSVAQVGPRHIIIVDSGVRYDGTADTAIDTLRLPHNYNQSTSTVGSTSVTVSRDIEFQTELAENGVLSISLGDTADEVVITETGFTVNGGAIGLADVTVLELNMGPGSDRVIVRGLPPGISIAIDGDADTDGIVYSDALITAQIGEGFMENFEVFSGVAAENQFDAGTLFITDHNSNTTPTYSIIGGPDQSLLSISPQGHLQFTAAPNREAPSDANDDSIYDVIVRLVDGSVSTDINAQVEISDINDFAPKLSGWSLPTGEFNEDVSPDEVIYTAEAFDLDAESPNNLFTFGLGTDGDSASFRIDPATGDVRLKPGSEAIADYELRDDKTRTITITVTDTGGLQTSREVTLTVLDVISEAPSQISLANALTTLPEHLDTTARVKVADVIIYDQGQGLNTLSLSGDAAALFEIEGGATYQGGVTRLAELYLKQGAVLAYTPTNGLDERRVEIALSSDVVGATDLSSVFTFTVQDVNDRPTGAVVTPVVTAISEYTDTSSRILVANLSTADDALGTNVFAITGVDAALFETVAVDRTSADLYFKAGNSIDYEAQATYSIGVTVEDEQLADSVSTPTAFTFAITDVPNASPTAVALINIVASLPEDVDTAEPIRIADITVSDDREGTNSFSLMGPDASHFELVGDLVLLKANRQLNFESKDSFEFTLQAVDRDVPGSVAVTQSFSLAITDINEAPSFTLGQQTITLSEATATTERVTLTAISIADDALGTNQVSITGPDRALFDTDGDNLYLRKGVTLDFEEKNTLQVTVTLEDPALGNPTTSTFILNVTDANEAPTSIEFVGTTITSIPENTDIPNATEVATIGLEDDAIGNHDFVLTGDDAVFFQVATTNRTTATLSLRAGVSLDYETKSSYAVTITGIDPSHPGNPVEIDYILSVSDVNAAPAGLMLGNLYDDDPGVSGSQILENADTSVPVKVADVSFTDDGEGLNVHYAERTRCHRL